MREHLIFKGDSETYKIAKDASDGLEHGFMELNTIAAHALKSADKTFHYVRRAIVELLDLSPEIADELMIIKPKDVQSRKKIVRGRLIGLVENPAGEDELYPSLQWSTGISSVLREGSTFHIKETENITARVHPDVTFNLDLVEIRGRIEDGQVPIELSEEDVPIKPTPEPASVKMLMAVGPMVDKAVASGEETTRSLPHVFAFNLFGQGVAFFESTYTLIRDQRPVEALSALRGLAIIASRFEQMSKQVDTGVGIAVRMALDAASDFGVDRMLQQSIAEH